MNAANGGPSAPAGPKGGPINPGRFEGEGHISTKAVAQNAEQKKVRAQLEAAATHAKRENAVQADALVTQTKAVAPHADETPPIVQTNEALPALKVIAGQKVGTQQMPNLARQYKSGGGFAPEESTNSELVTPVLPPEKRDEGATGTSSESTLLQDQPAELPKSEQSDLLQSDHSRLLQPVKPPHAVGQQSASTTQKGAGNASVEEASGEASTEQVVAGADSGTITAPDVTPSTDGHPPEAPKPPSAALDGPQAGILPPTPTKESQTVAAADADVAAELAKDTEYIDAKDALVEMQEDVAEARKKASNEDDVFDPEAFKKEITRTELNAEEKSNDIKPEELPFILLAEQDALTPEQRQQWERYKGLNRVIEGKERDLKIAALENTLNDPKATLSEDERKQKQKNLAALVIEKQNAHKEDLLAQDKEYQSAVNDLAKVRNSMRNRKLSIGVIQQHENDLREKGWNKLSPQEQELFDNNKKLFDTYMFNSALVQSKEAGAKDKAIIDTQRDGYFADGTKPAKDMTPQQIAKKNVDDLVKANESVRGAPSKLRKMWNAADKLFGKVDKAAKEEEFANVVKYAKLLKDNYGGIWRGLILPVGLQPEKYRESVKSLRHLLTHSERKLAVISGIRGLWKLMLLNFILLACSPVLVGKVLDSVKPFAGNSG